MKKKLALLFICLISANTVYGMSEKEKISYLLDRVEKSGVIFIRNGSEHTSKEARKHMELKLSNIGSRIKTVEDFIKYCGTESSFSGKKYMVKLKNGKTIESAIWLHQILKKINKKKDRAK